MKKQLVMVIMSCLVLGNIAPMVSAASNEEFVTTEETSYEWNNEPAILPPLSGISLFANQTEAGGSTYKYVSQQVVNLSGINNLYKALLAGGLAAVPMGPPVARAMVTTGLSSNFKGYKYMRQTIYKKSDNTYVTAKLK
ncbi:hypothetical protein [Listeria monocytogenes]|uniref:hypothetical protein n=1 Tax=Listeria monocytogenes TaxID=1639 RepID=UPI0011EAFAD6|nr:hypothetical protein [Listeria monocytogenes]TYV00767.1 hypothetical protein FZ054_15225 [Listeria monocytogenes]